MSRTGYRMLSQKSLAEGDIKSHLYLLMQWNLMVRTNNIASMNYLFMRWDEDSLAIKCPTSKADQTGERAYGKHIFANPVDAQCCVITALGLHVLCNSVKTVEDNRVFQHDAIESLFSKWLSKTTKAMTEEELLSIGM